MESQVLRRQKEKKFWFIAATIGINSTVGEEMKRRSDTTIPAKSTISNILKRNGRAERRTRIRQIAQEGQFLNTSTISTVRAVLGTAVGVPGSRRHRCPTVTFCRSVPILLRSLAHPNLSSRVPCEQSLGLNMPSPFP